jgi:hypothetical protein
MTIESTSIDGPSFLRGLHGSLLMNNCCVSRKGGGGAMLSIAAGCRFFAGKCRFELTSVYIFLVILEGDFSHLQVLVPSAG